MGTLENGVAGSTKTGGRFDTIETGGYIGVKGPESGYFRRPRQSRFSGRCDLEIVKDRGAVDMGESSGTTVVRVNVELTSEALQAIVQNAKDMAGTDEKGVYRVDTADKVSEMISRFLMEKDFEAYVKDRSNYT